MSTDDDDKPTVVLDLNAIKDLKLKKEEELAIEVDDIEFSTHAEALDLNQEDKRQINLDYKVILFDFQTDFLQKNLDLFPKGPQYLIANDLKELNTYLLNKEFQIVVFLYDIVPKAVNQLISQIKLKLPKTKTLIVAKNISPNKAIIHAKGPFGADGYYQLPLESSKLEEEFKSIYDKT